MKTTLKRLFTVLFLSGATLTAVAQAPTLSLRNIAGIGNTWHYGTVACTSPRPITSITLSMVNNEVGSIGNRTGAGINPATNGIFTSLGDNPRTVTYLFDPALNTTQVQNFIGGIDFTRNNTAVPGANPYVRISVDANPTNLPAGATITVWKDHPDGSPHYYVYVDVPAGINWDAAYNAAKSYYFQGMRGYLATMTSPEESQILTNISNQAGWSAGVRTPDAITDGITFSGNLNNNYPDFRWTCGPESGFAYYHGPSKNAADAGAINNAFNAWHPDEPNTFLHTNSTIEGCMNINYTALLLWNDYIYNGAMPSYFIEFGGSGEAYSVNGANYPANPAYKKPTIITNNAQWHNFSPGNTSVAGSTLKAAPLRSNMMVIE